MDALIGLTLDTSNAVNVVASPALSASVDAEAFEQLLGEEIQLLQPLLNGALTENVAVSQETEGELVELDQQNSEDVDEVSFLLTGQQQTVIQTSAKERNEPLVVTVQQNTDTENKQSPVANLAQSDAAASPPVSAKVSQENEESGKALPAELKSVHKKGLVLQSSHRVEKNAETDHEADWAQAIDRVAGDAAALPVPVSEKTTKAAESATPALTSMLTSKAAETPLQTKTARSSSIELTAPTATVSSLANWQPSDHLKQDLIAAATANDASSALVTESRRENSVVDNQPSSALFASDHKTVENIPSALRLPLFNPRFNDVMSNQVLWMSKQGLNQADIHLNPAELGPITVKLQQSGNETAVQFVVAHPSTKEQLEQALPRLREVLQQGGLQLINVDIQDGRKHSARDDLPAPANNANRASTAASALSSSLSAPLPSQAEGIVDFYA